MLELNSCRIGKTALRLLRPGACGRVLAGFSEAAYLMTEQAELFWLAPEHAPMHTRGMQIEGPFPKLAAGEAFSVVGGCIKISPGLKVHFGDASAWTASAIPAGTALQIEKIPFRVRSHFLGGLDLSQARGFGRLIPQIISPATSLRDEQIELDSVLALAWPGIHEVAKACLRRDMPGLFREAHALVGLGQGLTPSGDDFLGGLLFCVNCLHSLYPDLVCVDSSEKASFVESAATRTHLISFTLLKDMSEGRAVEPFHELMRTTLSDRLKGREHPASCLTQMGHSTGWDQLTGALTGFLMTFRGHDTKDSSALLPLRQTDA